ncbi:MAG: hypothetical protein KTR21_14595 [Rhodobacteraceae bacterium]|nr:hypothetical protein [Paracoccaceae bacterium]
MMRLRRGAGWASLIGVALMTTACGYFGKQEKAVEVRFPDAFECRTVKLFDQNMETPSSDLPDQWRVFAGHWGNGAWDGKLCHEFVVEAIYPDGSARVVDMQGDYAPWNRWPTAFRRKARFEEDGSLTVMVDGAKRVYRVENGVIYGVWEQVAGRSVGVTLVPVTAASRVF